MSLLHNNSSFSASRDGGKSDKNFSWMEQCESFLSAILNVTMIDYAKDFRDVNGD